MPSLSANNITASLLLELNERYQPHICIQRINVIVARAKRGTVRSARNGTSDILGCIRGIPVAIEVKTENDRMRTEQVSFGESWERAGGIYVIARDAERALAEIDSRVNRTVPASAAKAARATNNNSTTKDKL